MKENRQENSKRRLNSLILLVAFTAIMLIVSTYAWFSSQKNVTLGGLQGKVNVAEGLQISLNANKWVNEIDFSAFTIDEETGEWTSDEYLPGATLNEPYAITIDPDDSSNNVYAKNVLPSELFPVSTTAALTEAVGLTKINMYNGENTEGKILTDIADAPEVEDSGFYAIDFFLMNSSKTDGAPTDLLRLEPNSSFATLATDRASTGLQNTARVALALFANDGTANSVVGSNATNDEVNGTANIIAGTTGTTITDVAMWEPNANAHVQYIVDNNKYVLPDTEDAAQFTLETDGKRYGFSTTSQFGTYALTVASKAAQEIEDPNSADPENPTMLDGIANIYDWKTPATGLVKQKPLQTTTAGITVPTQLVSTRDGSTPFGIPAGQYVRMRMYLWLEGQDVDCVNYASLGGGVELNLGFSKPGNS